MHMESDMKLKEKKAIVKALIIGFISMRLEEEEEDSVLSYFRYLVPDPDFWSYVAHPDDFFDENGEIDIDAMINKGFDYKPIAL